MNHYTLLSALLAITVLLGCGTDTLQNPDSRVAATHDQLSDEDVVQEDARKLSNAVYNADVDTVLGYTHPKIIEMMGGTSQAKSALDAAFSKFQLLGMKLESMTFPKAPTFLKTDVNHFVIVPTKIIISANGQRLESLNYQFGIRRIGTTQWKYVEGSRINKQNVTTLFPDFPADYEFPEFYRRKL